jgi:NAD(P)-dependent dehydrogenase (short-subunit alcohol dehydrogenase family)
VKDSGRRVILMGAAQTIAQAASRALAERESAQDTNDPERAPRSRRRDWEQRQPKSKSGGRRRLR